MELKKITALLIALIACNTLLAQQDKSLSDYINLYGYGEKGEPIFKVYYNNEPYRNITEYAKVNTVDGSYTIEWTAEDNKNKGEPVIFKGDKTLYIQNNSLFVQTDDKKTALENLYNVISKDGFYDASTMGNMVDIDAENGHLYYTDSEYYLASYDINVNKKQEYDFKAFAPRLLQDKIFYLVQVSNYAMIHWRNKNSDEDHMLPIEIRDGDNQLCFFPFNNGQSVFFKLGLRRNYIYDLQTRKFHHINRKINHSNFFQNAKSDLVLAEVVDNHFKLTIVDENLISTSFDTFEEVLEHSRQR